ncbi:MAG TPA: flagellar basal body-associated FliL family protein [Steroidobacteraceae bacterium]|nr:flagellar basal body-associated FliL family protein [Steroidobacteraceae bacterium]
MSEEKVAPPKKSKKGLLIVILSVVVLAGGGAGAYFALRHKDTKAAKAAPAAAVKLPAQFVELSPPFVVNLEPGSSARFLQVAVQLMTRDPKMVEFLKANMPIIKNDLTLLFGNKHAEEVSTEAGKEALRAAALDAVRHIISSEGGKPEQLEAVYFTSFVMQ